MNNSLLALLSTIGLSILGMPYYSSNQKPIREELKVQQPETTKSVLAKQNDAPGTFHKGLEYVVNDDDYYSFKYTRIYSHIGSDYFTVYTIYHPKKGYAWLHIIVEHSKPEKRVVVKIEDAGGGVLSALHEEETTYTIPSLQHFGNSGVARALGGNRVPNVLEVQFANDKFEYVNVTSVYAGTTVEIRGGDNGGMYYFILDQK